jgi:PAS domain S-box-containing protein
MVWVEIPRAATVAAARHFVEKIAGVAVIFIVLGTLGAWFLSNRVTVPLSELSRAANDVAQGNYSRRVDIAGPDELGLLGQVFNHMAARVESDSSMLRAHAEDLEAANAELQESERRYEQLVDLSPDAIIFHRERRVLFANAAAVRMFGVTSPDELIGRSVFDLVRATDRDWLDRRLQLAQSTPEQLPFFEREVRRHDGSMLSVESASTPFVLDGVPSLLTMFRDLSERKRLEAQFQHSQRMEAVGQLAGGVAHDFNNLLTVITSYSGMLLSELSEDAAAWADLQEISRAADRAAGLTRQLLAFSRQQVLEPRLLDLNEVARDMNKMLHRLLREDIALHTVLTPSLDTVFADAGQIEQVIVNLVVNARDAMPDGGMISIETANVELDQSYSTQHMDVEPGSYVMLAVSDNGYGMDAATQARIFEPFFTTKEVGHGTGLGLSTVYGIVKQSGGHIWLYSELGLGTTIKVYLPRMDVAADALPRSGTHTAIGRGTERILLAEDETQVRLAARRILERSGYEVLEATSATEALQLCEDDESSIDLLLTDMVMPEMSGRMLAEAVRARRPEVSVVFMSGYTDDTAIRHNLVETGTLYLQKPFTPDALARKVREALDAS